MVGDNPRADKFFRTLRNTGGKAVSSPGVASGTGPSRYQTDGPTKALYDAQFRLMDDQRFGDQFFGTIEAMQAWVDSVTQQQWPFYNGPRQTVWVVLHDPPTFTYESGKILAPRAVKAAWRGLHCIHELAHHYGEPTGHGLTFVRVMIQLMDVTYGRTATDLFRQHLTTEGVQI